MHVDFFYAGAPRAGSTWLYQCIREHPQVCISKKKEAAPEFVESDLLDPSYYEKNFSQCNNQIVKGAFPVALLFNKEKISQLGKHYPKTKFILCLRNPVQRAVSHFNHYKSRGLISEKVLLKDASRNKKEIIECGLYFKYLSHLLDVFPKENVLVTMYDEIVEEPEAVLRRVFKFLGVDAQYSSEYTHKVVNPNVRRRIKSKTLKNSFDSMVGFKKGFINNARVVSLLRRLRLDRVSAKIKRFNEPDPYGLHMEREAYVINEDDRSLLRDIYLKDIVKLEDLLQKDLTHWK